MILWLLANEAIQLNPESKSHVACISAILYKLYYEVFYFVGDNQEINRL